MTNNSLLGEKIESARKKKKLSQAKLAELIGVSRASISLYETGAGNPSYKVLAKLAEELDIFFSELAGLTVDYNFDGSLPTRQGFVDMNEIRSHLIKTYLRWEEQYAEVDFSYPENVEINMVDVPEARRNQEIDFGLMWPTMCVLAIPGINYSDAIIYAIKDNRMGARYPVGSRHVIHPIMDKSKWQYLTGMHAILIEDQTIIIRRIASNKEKLIVLADASGNEMSVGVEDIRMIWKVGQAVHMPAED